MRLFAQQITEPSGVSGSSSWSAFARRSTRYATVGSRLARLLVPVGPALPDDVAPVVATSRSITVRQAWHPSAPALLGLTLVSKPVLVNPPTTAGVGARAD